MSIYIYYKIIIVKLPKMYYLNTMSMLCVTKITEINIKQEIMGCILLTREADAEVGILE